MVTQYFYTCSEIFDEIDFAVHRQLQMDFK